MIALVLWRLNICQKNCGEEEGRMWNHSKLLTDLKQTWELQISSHVGSWADMRHLALLLVYCCYTFPCVSLRPGFLYTEWNWTVGWMDFLNFFPPINYLRVSTRIFWSYLTPSPTPPRLSRLLHTQLHILIYFLNLLSLIICIAHLLLCVWSFKGAWLT